MTRLSRALALAGVLWLSQIAAAAAQNYPSGSITGNAGASPAPPRAITPTAWIDRWCSSSQGFVIYRGASAWNCAAPGETSGVQLWNADLDALSGFASTGFAARLSSGVWAQRTITGTANEITVGNGNGVSGDPTVSLPSSLIFTGKSIASGTFNSPALVTPAIGVAAGTSLALGGATIGTNNLAVTGTAAISGNITGAAHVFAGVNNAIGMNTRSLLTSAADGVLMLSNFAGSDFSRLQFGGTTSSFPSIKRTTTALNVRLADDSADAPITASNGTFSGTLSVTGHPTLEGTTATGATGTGKLVFDANASMTSLTVTSAFTATGLVGNSALANANAYTFKGNPTGSAAAPTDFTIGSLTQKTSPDASDLVILSDSAAGGATKYATVSSIASAGSVATIAGNTGVFTLSNGITNSTNDIRLASLTLNQVLANFTGSTAIPAGFTMPSCADSGTNHLNYVNGTGITCGTSGVVSKVINSSRDLTTASGNQDITGFGFNPTSCQGFGSVGAVATASYTVFHSVSDATPTVGQLYGGASAYQYSTAQFFIVQDATGANYQAAALSYITDGVRLAWTKTASPTGTFLFTLKCFKGTFMFFFLGVGFRRRQQPANDNKPSHSKDLAA